MSLDYSKDNFNPAIMLDFILEISKECVMKILGSIVWIVFSVLMIVGGIIGLVTPLETFASLIFLLPIFLFVGGIGSVLHYINVRHTGGAGFILADGLMSIAFAIIFYMSPMGFTSMFVVTFVAFMTMFKGILGLGYAFELKKLGVSWVLALIVSILNVIIAVVFIVFPIIGGITMGVMIALLVLFFGLASLALWFSNKEILKNA